MGRTRYERAQGCELDKEGHLHPRTDVTIYDPVAKTQTYWAEGLTELKIARVSALPGERKPPTQEQEADRAAQAELCKRKAGDAPAQQMSLGTAMIADVAATGQRSSTQVEAGQEGNTREYTSGMRESWWSSELGTTMRAIFDDARQGRLQYEVVSVTRGEPDPRLFAPPDGYVVRKALEQH